ncbi:hypothetical protein A3768_4797 (plasmid) [Ralstonia solanacearum]|nr:hypothetical protein A3768_4797 [Ralstonia solanacearum]
MISLARAKTLTPQSIFRISKCQNRSNVFSILIINTRFSHSSDELRDEICIYQNIQLS